MGDPYFADVAYLFHCDGTNGSTALNDSASSPISAGAAASPAALSTTAPKFGTASLALGATGSATFDNSKLTLGAADHTVEFWHYYDASNAQAFSCLFTANSTNLYAIIFGSSTSNLVVYSNTLQTADTTGAAHGMVNGAWNFIRATRVGTLLKLFVAGSVIWTGNLSSNGSLTPGAGNAYLGVNPGAPFYSAGKIDDVRVTIGLARDGNANFTPPSAAFPDSNDTTVGPGSAVLTGYAPTFPRSTSPGLGTTVLIGYQPGLSYIAGTPVGFGSLALSGRAISFSQAALITAGSGSATLTGLSPAVLNDMTVRAASGGLALGGFAPSVAAWFGVPITAVNWSDVPTNPQAWTDVPAATEP